MISVNGLSKRYGGRTAVDGVTFSCPPGTVTGFLGPNGAGKSTTLRVIAGLTPATRGTATIAGLRYQDIPNPAAQVGLLLDASALHAGRTGREVLALDALAMGLPRGRVDEVLELAGLTRSEARRRVREYSLGMRQRLGIAHALLGDPRVLILDEPANGLDPEGISWMRGLLRGFARRGGTVLLSTHLLHEAEVISDRLLVIGGGRILVAGTKAELLARAADVSDHEAGEGGGSSARGGSSGTGGNGGSSGNSDWDDAPVTGSALERLYLQLTARSSRGPRSGEAYNEYEGESA